MAAATGRMLRECHSMGIPMVGAIKPPFERARLSSTGRGRIPQLPVEPHVNGLGGLGSILAVWTVAGPELQRPMVHLSPQDTALETVPKVKRQEARTKFLAQS